MEELIDFSDCPVILGRAYNGANGKKIAISYHGEIYMLKFPPSGENKPTQLSYTNGCISEHLASSIFNLIGVRAQETKLGTYKVAGKTKIVCACRDFTTDGKRFFDFCSIKNTVLDSDSNGTGTELPEVLETVEKQQYLNSAVLTEHFWNMFVIDALLGTFDRHNGNWGFLYDDQTHSVELAPVYDCGSCLLPQADDTIMRSVMDDKNELQARVFRFPTSALKLNGRKINYHDFLTKADNPDCNEAVMRIVPRIDMEKISEFVNGVSCLTELQKAFYTRYLGARKELILDPAFEIVRALQHRFEPIMTI